jgi:ribose transport system permease protein
MSRENEAQPQPGVRSAQTLLTRLRPFVGLIALVILCAVFGVSRPRFFSPDNFFNILNAVALVGILAVGQAFPLIGGGFDLSQGAVAGLSGVVVAGLMSRYGQSLPGAILGGLLAGASLGAVNGVLVAWVRINPFVATLGTQITFLGISLVCTNNQPVSLGPQGDQLQQLSFGKLGPFTPAAVLFLLLTALLGFVLRMLPFGQHVYTLGGNEEATRLAGINATRVKILTYVFSGLLAAVAGLVMIAQSGQASPNEGPGKELESLASCIIGGIALGGGVGSAWNVLLGAVTLEVITNGLQMLGGAISPNWQLVIRGAIILLAVGVDARARLRR